MKKENVFKVADSVALANGFGRAWVGRRIRNIGGWMYNVYVWMYTLNVYVFVLSGSPTGPGGSGNLTSVTLPLIPKFHKSFDLEHSLLIRISQYPMQLQATYWIIRSLKSLFFLSILIQICQFHFSLEWNCQNFLSHIMAAAAAVCLNYNRFFYKSCCHTLQNVKKNVFLFINSW